MAKTWTSGKFIDSTSCAASFNSDEVAIDGADVVGLELHSAAAGTRAGTVAIQASCSGDNWNAIAFYTSAGALVTSLTVTASTLFSEHIDLTGMGARRIRVAYTASTGTGSLDGYVVLKNKR
jgi:hypothetical protein